MKAVNDTCDLSPLNLLGLTKGQFFFLLDIPPTPPLVASFVRLPLLYFPVVEETNKNKGRITETSYWAGLKLSMTGVGLLFS